MEGEWVDQKKQSAFKEQQTKSPDPNNTQWRSDTSGFGFQMLMKMGWKDGNGLGKNEQGDPTVLKTLKQFDKTGLGVEKSKPSANNWLETKASFDDLLKRLNSEVLPVDEPMASDGDQKKKRKRSDEKEKKPEKKKRRKNESSELETEKMEKRQDAEKALKSVRVLYPKRAASKMISLFSENDMNQILGHGAKLTSRPSEEVKPISVNEEKESSSSSEGEEEEKEEQKQEKKEKKKKEKKEKKEKKAKKAKKAKKDKSDKKEKKDKKKKRKNKDADQTNEEE